MASESKIFSILAMFILFREALEACVIVAVLLQMCERLHLRRLKKQVWAGAISGVIIVILLGSAFITVFYTIRTRVFTGKGKAIFVGYINLLAATLITMLAFAMLKFMNYEAKWRRKLEGAAAEKNIEQKRASRYAFFLLAFIAVLREGLEVVVFLGGVSGSVEPTAIPLAGIVGIILGILVGLALYYTGRTIASIKWFFWITCFLLFAIAAGLVSRGMSSWQSIGWFGTLEPAYDTPWWNKAAWDWSGCCSDDVNKNKFFALMGALFGYQARPSFISLVAYFGFWAIVIFDFCIKWRRGTLFDAEGKRKRKEAKLRAKQGLPPLAEDGEGAPQGEAALGDKGPDAEDAPSVLPSALHHGQKGHTSHESAAGKGGRFSRLFGGKKAAPAASPPASPDPKIVTPSSGSEGDQSPKTAELTKMNR